MKSERTATKSRTAIMNDRKRASGQRQIKIWITDTRDTELNAAFDEKLQERLADIVGLSEHYKSKLEDLK
tara:strand:- start:24 stop:233 length:210 start_codon:yes stop_codon:yes gene_type:complete